MLRTIIGGILQFYVVIILARVLLSWFPISFDSPMVPVVRLLDALTNPILGPIRRALPPARLGGAALDLSPLIVIVVIQVILLPLIYR